MPDVFGKCRHMIPDTGNWSHRNERLEWKQPQCIGWSVGVVIIISLQPMLPFVLVAGHQFLSDIALTKAQAERSRSVISLRGRN